MEKEISTPKVKRKTFTHNSFSPCPVNPLMPINPNLFFRENNDFNSSMSPNILKFKFKKKLEWTEEEDNNIKKFVNEFGTKKWKTLSEIYPGKTPKQYREHYYNCLETNVLKKIDFTQNEDEIILSFVQGNGRKFAKLSKMMPGRTETSIKNRYYFLTKRSFQNVHNNEKSEFVQEEQNNSFEICVQSMEPNVEAKRNDTTNEEQDKENLFDDDLATIFNINPFYNHDQFDLI